jgi:hypothetical protein
MVAQGVALRPQTLGQYGMRRYLLGEAEEHAVAAPAMERGDDRSPCPHVVAIVEGECDLVIRVLDDAEYPGVVIGRERHRRGLGGRGSLCRPARCQTNAAQQKR